MTDKEVITLIQAKDNKALEALVVHEPKLGSQKTEQGISFLTYAAYCRNAEAVSLFRRGRKDLDLFEAAIVGDVERVAKKIEWQPEDVHAFSVDGFTALGLACFFGQMEIARLLIAHGANVDTPSRNSFKVAPIHSSCAISSYKITELLLQNKANANARQQSDVTPLHEAAHNGQDDLVKLLLHYGADVNAKTDKGQTPMSMAEEKKFTTTANLLKSRGGTL